MEGQPSCRSQEKCLSLQLQRVPAAFRQYTTISLTLDHLLSNKTSKSRDTPNLESLVDGSLLAPIERSCNRDRCKLRTAKVYHQEEVEFSNDSGNCPSTSKFGP
eukprot:scaffold6176_cov173-Cylindrotheca_fusiformis.AAC.1